MLSAKLRKSGGSIILSIPKSILDLVGLTESDSVAIRVVDGQIVLSGGAPDGPIEETPELLSQIAKTHAATAKARQAVDQATRRQQIATIDTVIPKIHNCSASTARSLRLRSFDEFEWPTALARSMRDLE